jgi:hypothetical protein
MPPAYPAAAYGPPPTVAPAAAVPWWVWMAAGIAVAKVADFVQSLVKKGPQQMMAEMVGHADGRLAACLRKGIEWSGGGSLPRL